MRGDLHRLLAPKDARGHEQSGARYAVVVHSDDLPLSSRPRPRSRGETRLPGGQTRVIVEQLRIIDPQHRLGDFVGRLTAVEMQEVDAALRAMLALD